MADRTSYAELEISLHARDSETFGVDLRLERPDTEEIDRTVNEAVASFDLTALDELMADEEYDEHGKALARALFAAPEIKSRFDAASGLEIPVQFRLVIAPAAEELHKLAWETLCDPDTGRRLLTGDNLLFARYLSSTDRRPVRPRLKGDLNALICVANPRSSPAYPLAELTVDAEITSAKQGLGTITTATLGEGPATLLRLIEHLRRHSVDILYLVCHGRLAHGKPILYFEDDKGDVDPVSGLELADQIAGLERRPHLVVLASCESAGIAEGSAAADAGALTGIGPLLVRAGVPTVLAMHGRIATATSSTFVRKFFGEITNHGRVDQAAASARRAVGDQADFWMPVLFTRVKSGRLWYATGFGGGDADFRRWKSVVNNIERGHCLVVLGPGLLESLVGSPEELTHHWAADDHRPFSEDARRDLARMAQYLALDQDVVTMREDLLYRTLPAALARHLGDAMPPIPAALRDPAQLDALISAAGAVLRQNPTEPHAVLARLPFPIYLTANADRLLEDALAAPDVNRSPRSAVFPWRPDPNATGSDGSSGTLTGGTIALGAPAANQGPLVYHLLGRYNDPESLVLTEDNHFDFLIGSATNRQQIPLEVRTALNSKALLFLGFHFDDWDFRVLFRTIIWHRRTQSWLVPSQAASDSESALTHVAVQLDLEGGPIEDPKRARRYFEDFFRRANIGTNVNIYWGDAASFLRDLWQRWEERPGAAATSGGTS